MTTTTTGPGTGAGHATTPTSLPAGFVDYSQYLNVTPRPSGSQTPVPNPTANTSISMGEQSQQQPTAPMNSNAAPGPSKPPAGDGKRADASDTDDDPEKKRRRASSAGEGDGGAQRVQLACFWCRSKRIRCSGTKPICEACQKASVTCEWPSGRRKKRTRKEMEEARRLEAQHNRPLPPDSPESYTADISHTTHGNNINDGGNTFDISQMSNNDLWNFASSSNYVWPTGFTPEGQASGSGNIAHQPMNQQSLAQNFQLPGMNEPTIGQFMNTSPGTDMRLINALESGAAYIEGNPAEDDDIELFYYRFSGATAVHPGINRISLKLQKRNGTTRGAPQPESDASTSNINPLRSTTPADLFDQSGLPHPHIYIPLFDLFFKHMSQHFPSISRQRMNDRFANGTMSAFLACCICAHGARFAENPRDTPSSASTPFIAQAQDLIIPLIHLPTTDVVTGLVLLAWLCYGQGSEAGMWTYSGMAFRMAIDLGLHENSEVYETPAHVIRTRHLFWNMFITDRIVAFALGRPASISEDIIEIPLPEDKDFFPDPARNIPGAAPEAVEAVPFVHLTKLMIICGRISNVLNGRRGKARTLVSSAEPLAEQLAELQLRLVQFVSTLPETLKWSAENFKRQQNRGHGGTYLALHLWSNAVLALIYHPDLLKSPSGIETPLNATMNRNVKLALASSRQICECMVFADLVDSSSYCATPYLTQPLFVAGMALIHEIRAGQMQSNEGNGNEGNNANANPTDVFLLSMSRQNFQAVLNAVFKMEQYWAGVTNVSQLLEKRSGVSRPFPRQLKGTFISLPDKGLLRRFRTDPSDPQHPPTETSLRESIARSERSNSASGPSPYWLSDLMAGYTVENMSFAPADSFDLERLLATTQHQPQQPGQTPLNLSGGQMMGNNMGMGP